MLPFEDRFSRQRRLPEVGPEGQRRIEQSRLQVPRHPGRAIELEYLSRAGVRQLESTDKQPEPFPFEQQFTFAASAQTARGCYGALTRLKSILDKNVGGRAPNPQPRDQSG